MFGNENFERTSLYWDQRIFFNKMMINTFLSTLLVDLHTTKDP